MGRAISDLNIEAGYPYTFRLDINSSTGDNLEGDYACYFECKSTGKLQFAVVAEAYDIVIPKEKTALMLTNLEQYTVYTVKTSDGTYDKILEGRLHVNKKVRS